ncbi:hypothetical protein [Legionella waltersii]|uniref:Transmembrane protein n=1 Tax=Legionella waltersii TaxID=66969 RepID=A0A0W1AMW3_9GAMM|nr:hypothetical protein [Legionella waltersii]KTD82515.1 transmembrane protein [Legionella waltersii]SNV02997.1 transmembrane protein [Legionella waltersii]
MIKSITKRTRAIWDNWVSRRIPKKTPQVLGSHNIYILPSGFGWIYGLVVLSFFSGAINYQISTIFLMTFLLAVVALVSAWEAHANLKNLSFQLVSIEDSYQNTPAQLTILIKANRKIHFGLEFKLAQQDSTRLESIPQEGIQFVLPIMTSERGCFHLPRITVSSLYPFGIFKVWGYVQFDIQYYVYPQPINPGFWPPPMMNQDNKNSLSPGDNEFYDLRQVESPWEQPNLIAWKIAAKEQGWYVKQMDNAVGTQWQFSLKCLTNLDLEQQLQHLSYWLNEAETNQQQYSLQLNSSSRPLGRGPEHLQQCLRQLASYQ